MNVLLATDSFKGSLSSIEVVKAIELGIKKASSSYNVRTIPIADGGEGTYEVLMNARGKKRITLEVMGPLFESITVEYGVLDDDTVIIEIARIAGLGLVPKEQRNPLYTTTYGLGEVILDAMKRGYSSFIIGVGGSATNDAGVGMLAALGYKFYDANHNELNPIGKSLIDIVQIESCNADEKLKDATFKVMCDVDNPFYGKNGAAHVYAKQKGASTSDIQLLDDGLKNFSSHIKQIKSIDLSDVNGSGAAGGLAGAFYAFLDTTLEEGTSIIFDAVSLEEEIKWADIVVTGEGKIDYQTFSGKAPFGVMRLAKKHNKKIILVAGIVELKEDVLKQHDIKNIYSIMDENITLDEAMEPDMAKQLLQTKSYQIFSNIM